MTQNPLVSIIIPVYNGSDFMKEAIDSALAQTYQEREVIVVNDGSRDDGRTREIALSYGSRIVYIEKENGGVATALNAGIKAAKGRYISWLSHDDLYLPDKLERQVPVMERYEAEGRKVILYSSFYKMDEGGAVWGEAVMPDVPPERFYEALLSTMVFRSAFKRTPFSMHGCTLLLPKSVFEEVGLFDEALRTTQDFALWFKVNERYDFVRSDGFTVRSRIHKGQGTYLLRKERVGEVEDLYANAFAMYRSGSEKYDLDLARTAYALKVTMRRRAYAMAKAEMKRQGHSMRSCSYLLRAMFWNRYFIKMNRMAHQAIAKLF
jgi:hypothetical protein